MKMSVLLYFIKKVRQQRNEQEAVTNTKKATSRTVEYEYVPHICTITKNS